MNSVSAALAQPVVSPYATPAPAPAAAASSPATSDSVQIAAADAPAATAAAGGMSTLQKAGLAAITALTVAGGLGMAAPAQAATVQQASFDISIIIGGGHHHRHSVQSQAGGSIGYNGLQLQMSERNGHVDAQGSLGRAFVNLDETLSHNNRHRCITGSVRTRGQYIGVNVDIQQYRNGAKHYTGVVGNQRVDLWEVDSFGGRAITGHIGGRQVQVTRTETLNGAWFNGSIANWNGTVDAINVNVGSNGRGAHYDVFVPLFGLTR